MSNSYNDFGNDFSAPANTESLGLHDAGSPEAKRTEVSRRTFDEQSDQTDQRLTGLDALPTDEFLRIVGLRVRTRRSALSMSRKRLAEVSGVSERYLAQLESGQGNMSIALLRKVTASIGVALGSLLSAEIPDAADASTNSDAGNSSRADANHQQPSHSRAPRSRTHSQVELGARASAKTADDIVQSKRLVTEV